MDVFDLIGGEMSDISSWEEEEDDEEEDEEEVEEKREVEQLVTEVTGSSTTVWIGEDKCSGVGEQRELDENKDTQPSSLVSSTTNTDTPTLDSTTCTNDDVSATPSTTTTTANPAKTNTSGNGDALNLFTINPVSKEAAQDYAPLLGLSVESFQRSQQHAAQVTRTELPFLKKHPELDVFVLDNVLTEAECNQILATVRARFIVLVSVLFFFLLFYAPRDSLLSTE